MEKWLTAQWFLEVVLTKGLTVVSERTVVLTVTMVFEGRTCSQYNGLGRSFGKKCSQYNGFGRSFGKKLTLQWFGEVLGN